MGTGKTQPILSVVLIALIFTIASCGGGNSSGGSPNIPATPTISALQPSTGPVGTSVVVTGTNLTGATAISFNGTSATFTLNSATQITATVPTSATTGKVLVTTPGGSATSAGNFTVTVPAQPPAITSFNPTSGPVGTGVIVTGTNLTGATAFGLNGTTATFTVNSATQITATIPAGATTGKFSVTTPGGSTTSANTFTVNTSSATLDLTIDGLYVTQATQDYPNPTVPLVKDRSGWVRVFVKANIANTATPQVKVDFINGSTTVGSLMINATTSSVPTTIDPNTNNSWNAAVPSAWILPGVQVTATVDPSGAIAESDKTNNQFSLNSLDVRTLHPWKVTLIPVKTTDGLTGVVESGSFTRTNWVDFAKRLHPVPDVIDVAVAGTFTSSVAGSPTLSSSGTNWGSVLNEISAKRSADGATAADRYYFGVVKVGYSSGVAGLGFVGFPAAIGWDYQSSAPGVFAHEEGHNFNRQHSPCGGASNPDLNYPYAGGLIGVPGWDVFASSNNLKDQNTFTDIMGYCPNQWISDYVYTSELNYRQGLSFDVVSADVVNGTSSQEALLVWGRIENGNVILGPAFKVAATGIAPQPGPYVWQAKDALGQVLMTLPFDAPEVADLPDSSLRMFSFVAPMSADTMSRISSVHLSKDGKELTRATAASGAAPMLGARAVVRQQFLPNHKMQFSWDAARSPMVMLRDAKTGEVRGFLSGGNATIEDAPDDLEVQFSDGIHSEAVRYQRPAE